MRGRLHHAGALVAMMTAVNLISSSVEVAAITIAEYTTDTNVTEHSELDLDVQEIEELSDAFDFDGAYVIYSNGKYSKKTDNSFRTIQGFSTDADDKLSGEKWFDIYNGYWGTPDYADVFTSAACNGDGDFAEESDIVRAECCTKGAQYQNIWMYVIHELEDAIADCNNEDLTDNDGGVEAWDEGWAFWAGSLEEEDGEGDGVMGYALADNRCTQFGTCTGDDDDDDFAGTSAVNYKLLELYNEGKSKLEDFECDDVEVIKEEIVTLMTVPLVQGLLRYVYLADPNGGDEDVDDDEQDKERAELWAFSAAVLPQIDNCDTDVAADIRSNTDITSVDAPISAGYIEVKEMLESVYSCMGIKCSQVGGYYVDGSYVEGMEPCTVVIAGYISDTNVTEHSELDLDVMEIEELSDAYEFDEAYDIYSNGKYSKKTDSTRTIQGFSTDAEDKLAEEKWFNIYNGYWGMPDYADVFTSAACNGDGDFAEESDVVRAECCTKGAQYQNIWMYVIHELEDAIADCNNEDLTDNDGGVEAWDEGWAFWAGSLEGEDGEGDGVMGYALADNRCTQFGTCTGDDDDDDFAGTSAVNYKLLELYNEGKSNLEDFECDDVEVIKEEIVTLMTVPLVQGLLRYVYLADPNGGDEDEDDAEQDKERAELWAFSAAVLPQIHNCDTEVADVIRSNTDITSDDAPISAGYIEVKEKLESVYSCMGITCYQVGGYYVDGSYVEGMEPCVGITIAGYTTDTDVTEHSELDLDVMEIEELSDAYEFDEAYDIYSNGKYSKKTDSTRTIQGFSTDAQEKLSGEVWFDIYEEYWGTPDYADVFTSAACNGDGDFAEESDIVRAECCTKGAQYQNIWMYVIHELEDAISDCNIEDLTANNGGVEAWDEGWAFWAGSLEEEDGEGDGVMGYALADNRCTQFGTCTGDDDDDDFAGTSAVNYKLLELYNEGKSKLQDFDCDDVEDIKEEIVTLMTVPLIQGLLRYVYLADPNGGDEDVDDDEQDKERAELWAFSAAVLPQIDNCDTDVAAVIRSNTDITSDHAPISAGYVEVKEKLESVYSCMGIKCSQVGGYYVDGSYVEGMEPCSDSSNSTEDWEIAVGVIVALIVVGAAICLCIHCRRKKRAIQARAQAKTAGDDVGGFEMETGTSTL